MPDHPTDRPTDKDTWEDRQKHALFFQNQLAIRQQATIASLSLSPILITIGLFMVQALAISKPEISSLILVVVFMWASFALFLAFRSMQSARHIEREYHDEHGKFFPGTSRYRLESYLLPSAGRRPWLSKAKKDDAADTTSA